MRLSVALTIATVAPALALPFPSAPNDRTNINIGIIHSPNTRGTTTYGFRFSNQPHNTPATQGAARQRIAPDTVITIIMMTGPQRTSIPSPRAHPYPRPQRQPPSNNSPSSPSSSSGQTVSSRVQSLSGSLSTLQRPRIQGGSQRQGHSRNFALLHGPDRDLTTIRALVRSAGSSPVPSKSGDSGSHANSEPGLSLNNPPPPSYPPPPPPTPRASGSQGRSGSQMQGNSRDVHGARGVPTSAGPHARNAGSSSTPSRSEKGAPRRTSRPDIQDLTSELGALNVEDAANGQEAMNVDPIEEQLEIDPPPAYSLEPDTSWSSDPRLRPYVYSPPAASTSAASGSGGIRRQGPIRERRSASPVSSDDELGRRSSSSTN